MRIKRFVIAVALPDVDANDYGTKQVEESIYEALVEQNIGAVYAIAIGETVVPTLADPFNDASTSMDVIEQRNDEWQAQCETILAVEHDGSQEFGDKKS